MARKPTPARLQDQLYDLYEKSVQSPQTHIDWVVSIYHDLRRNYPFRLREDFCGTFQLSCAWVSRNRANSAVGLDLDCSPLAYGKRRHLPKLTTAQRRRIRVLRKDAISVTKPGSDVILVGNFSFFILKQREELLRYFRAARRSLTKNGIFMLEMAGGPGMIAKMNERRTVHIGPKNKFVYQWDQKSFDPIHRNGHYAIHFAFPNGKKLRDAFTYDWRLWTIPKCATHSRKPVSVAPSCIGKHRIKGKVPESFWPWKRVTTHIVGLPTS